MPNNASVYVELGKALFELECYEEARDAYKKAIQLDLSLSLDYANQGKKLLNKGKALEEAEHFDYARTAYEQAIQFFPTDANTHASLGKVFELGRYEEARGAYNKQFILIRANHKFMNGREAGSNQRREGSLRSWRF